MTGPRLNDENVEAYYRDGYLKIQGFLSDKDKSCLDVTSAAMHDSDPFDHSTPHEPVIWVWRHKPGGERSAFPLSHSSVISKLVSDPVYHAVYRQLAGSAFLQLFEIVLFDKPAGLGEAFVWHADRAYYPVDPGDSISVWVAIDDCDEENGAMSFAKKSHLHKEAVAAPDVKTGAVPAGEVAPNPIDAGYLAERVDLKAGDAVVFMADTWHASAPNRSQRRRRGVVIRFWLQPVRFFPADGKSGAFVRQIVTPPGEVIEGPCFPKFMSNSTTVLS